MLEYQRILYTLRGLYDPGKHNYSMTFYVSHFFELEKGTNRESLAVVPTFYEIREGKYTVYKAREGPSGVAACSCMGDGRGTKSEVARVSEAETYYDAIRIRNENCEDKGEVLILFCTARRHFWAADVDM